MSASHPDRYVAAITGASGCEYGLRLVEELLAGGAAVDLMVSKAGLLILEEEAGLRLGDDADALRRALEARRRVSADLALVRAADACPVRSRGAHLISDNAPKGP